MSIDTDRVASNWTQLGQEDPLWAILSHEDKRGGRWDVDDFMATGAEEVGRVLGEAAESVSITFGRALDFGCGVGRLSQALAAHFEEVDGVDIAEPMIAQAREFNRHGGRCSYHLNTRPDLGLFPDEHFDFVYSNITLQHMEPELAVRYIREFVRVLRPGGAAVFQVADTRRRSHTMWRRLLRWGFVRWQALRRRPVMDMFGVPRAVVQRVVEAAGGVITQVQADDAAGPDWTSFRYCLQRVAATPEPERGSRRPS